MFLLPNLCGRVAEGPVPERTHMVQDRPKRWGRLMVDLGARSPVLACASRPKRRGRLACRCAGFAIMGWSRRMVGELTRPLVGATLRLKSSISRLRGISWAFFDNKNVEEEEMVKISRFIYQWTNSVLIHSHWCQFQTNKFEIVWNKFALLWFYLPL